MLLGRSTEGLVYVFGQPVRLLVVDDDPIMLEFAIAQLTHPGGEIVTASNGEEAWAALQGEGDFDLVISDLEMPVMNGFELLQNIRSSARHAHLPVVVLTSRDDMFAIDRAYEVGATSFATKPVNWRLLGYQLRYVMRGCDMEAEVRRAHQDAERTAQLRNSLLTLLKHETRTPLNAIIGYSELLKSWQDEEGRSLQEQLSFIDDLRAAGLDLSRILQRVFYFASLNNDDAAMVREPAPVESLVDDVLQSCAARARARGTVVQSAIQPDMQLVGNYEQLCRALSELIMNAITFSPERSTVSITAGRDEAGNIVIDIADQGDGLDGQELLRCVEPFAQREDPMTRRADGLGLGLATARRVVELHGGALGFGKAETGGLNVRVTLPRHPAIRREEEAVLSKRTAA